MRRLHTLRIVVITAGILLGSIVYGNQAAVLKKTIFSNGSFDQKGGVLRFDDFVNNTDVTIGFWMKVMSNDFDGRAHLLAAEVSSGADHLNELELDNMPTDGNWHYYFATIRASGVIAAYRDNGVFLRQQSPDDWDVSGLNRISVGAVLYNSNGWKKKSTEYDLLVDDVTIWNGVDDEIIEVHKKIGTYGSRYFERHADDDRLVANYDFDNNAISNFYYEEANTSNVGGFWGAADVTPVPTVTANEKPEHFILRIESAFGGEFVSPKVSESGDYEKGTEIDFEAPTHVYLDQMGRELDVGELDRAVYRAECVGYSVEGLLDGNLVVGGSLLFSETIEADTTVTWNWTVEYARKIDSATANYLELSASAGDPNPAVGTEWIADNDLFDAQIDGNVGAGAQPLRFSHSGFVVENLSTASDRMLYFSSGDDRFEVEDIGKSLRYRTVTVEFWARLDEPAAGRRQVAMSLGRSTGGGGTHLQVGFDEQGHFGLHDGRDSVFSGSRTDGGWHHWALVFDQQDQVTMYRDGTMIHDVPTNLSFRNSDRYGRIDHRFMSIGGAMEFVPGLSVLNNPLSALDEFHHAFGGGIARLRLWDEERSENEIQESMHVERYVGENKLVFQQEMDTVAHAAAAQLGELEVMELVEPLELPDAYTVEARVRFPIADFCYILGGDEGYLGANSQQHLSLSPQSGSNYKIRIRAGNGINGIGFVDVTNVSDGWHTITAVMEKDPDTVTVYFDGVPMGTMDDLVPNLPIQYVGNDYWGGGNVVGMIDEARVWDVALPAATVQAYHDKTLTGSEPGLLALWNFEDGSDPGKDATGNGNTGRFGGVFKFNEEIEAPAEPWVETLWFTTATGLTAEFNGFSYDWRYPSLRLEHKTLLNLSAPTFQLFPAAATIPEQISTIDHLGQPVVHDWVRLGWNWRKQFRLDVSVASLDPQVADTAIGTLAFVEHPGGIHYGATSVQDELWVNEFDRVRIGTQYRTNDRCATLAGPMAQLNAFTAVTGDSLVDGLQNGKVTREFVFDAITQGGSMVWTYGRTVFRAEVTLGETLDASSSAAANLQLVPNLCDGAELRLTGAGPTLQGSSVYGEDLPGGNLAPGKEVVWDAVGERIVPVIPGIHRLDWTDANDPGKSYQIEIATHFPESTATLNWDRENEDGTRQGSHPSYVTEVTMGAVSDAFPASPTAHYRNIYRALSQAPLVLDPLDTDRWNFVTYAGGEASAVDENGTLKVSSAGRSILLYSYHPEATGVANGDVNAEAYAVRIVQSLSVDSARQADDVVSDDDRSLARFDGTESAAISLQKSDGDGNVYPVGVDSTIEFWCKAENLNGKEDRLIVSQHGDLYGVELGFRGRNNANPGAFFLRELQPQLPLHLIRGQGQITTGDTADSGHFAYVERSGDFVLEARVSDLAGNDWYSDSVGLMARASTADDSPMVYVLRHATSEEPNKRFRFYARAGAGAPLQNVGERYLSIDTADAWLRLARIGDAWYGSVSEDGVTWEVLGSSIVAMGEAPTPKLGICATTHNTSNLVLTEGTVQELTLNGDALSEFSQNLDIGSPATPGDLSSQQAELVVPDMVSHSNSWHHWSVVRNGGVRKIYFDGRLVAERTLPQMTAMANPVTQLGYPLSGPSLGFEGKLDNLRIWNRALTTQELRKVLLTRDVALPSGLDAMAAFPFDNGITNEGADANIHATPSDDTVSEADLLRVGADGHSEVATRLTSRFDTIGAESGYILNERSNYNASLYNRDALVGQWGPVYPVNRSELYAGAANRLEIAYYENPFARQPVSQDVLHPNVAWPYLAVSYDAVVFPTDGVHAAKRIYIASRIGSEGVDAHGDAQEIFDPAIYRNLSIYNQPDRLATGYNPNEEHALVAPSILAGLTGDSRYKMNQHAAFALQVDLNVDADPEAADYTSDPWVLTQEQRVDTGEWEMAAYKVEKTRQGVGLFPALDSNTHEPTDELGQPVPQPENPTYDFDYSIFAGDLLVPPYPLNLVVGNLTTSEAWGGNLNQNWKGDPLNQRVLWMDKNGNNWCVSGEHLGEPGACFYRYWYPMREDFWYDRDDDGENDVNTGTAVAWLPPDLTFLEDGSASTHGPTEGSQPQTIAYRSFWRQVYPGMKRGETVTHAGGEHKQDNPDNPGLPSIVGWASGQVVYDSFVPEMVFDLTGDNGNRAYSSAVARLIRPLDRIEADLALTAVPELLRPANQDAVMVVGERWYFRALTGSLQKRLYYDSLREKLVLRGRLNDLESGDSELTKQPLSLSVLQANVMTGTDYSEATSLSNETDWIAAVEAIDLQARDPNATQVDLEVDATADARGFQDAGDHDRVDYYSLSGDRGTATLAAKGVGDLEPHDSLGVGGALLQRPAVYDYKGHLAYYITLVENNHADVSGAVSVHVVEVLPERYRGAIKVIEPQDVFDEKVELQFSGDFGGVSDEIYFQWWVRDVANLDTVGLPGLGLGDGGFDPGWQLYREGPGLHKVSFQGRPDIALADKLFYVRYGSVAEIAEIAGEDPNTTNPSISNAAWELVDPNDRDADYVNNNGDPVPFQWGGASNSPQLQADGSRRFLPQLMMGWVKRVLDRVNPYEARYSDFYNNESPATYSSQIQIAGAPFIGKVALNSDKNVIENVGLIQLYETVLKRARELTIDLAQPNPSYGTDMAVMLASTRLATMYELLAREAYSDAQNPLVPYGDGENDLLASLGYAHAFSNQEPDLLHEELALLRGTDFIKAYPSYNRLFWNYVKGIGEAAYNATYNIHDVNVDGFINEEDAATLYPQGHGDAWGHFLSANKMHYDLLRHNSFTWRTSAELYSLLDNVIEADYMDERSFVRIAAAKARAGRDVVQASCRLGYQADASAQWQGDQDVDAARAWGVSEWANRSGQGALFDWALGNGLTREADPVELEGLDRLDRRAVETELSELAGAYVEIQRNLDRYSRGALPNGVHGDSIVFDLDPLRLDGDAVNRDTHFEQIYERAVEASESALAGLALASRRDVMLRDVALDTEAMQVEAIRQDLSYRNRLIEIFGRPYDGTIGPGQIYDEGYEGPDLLLYRYVDYLSADDLAVEAGDRYQDVLLELSDLPTDNPTVVFSPWLSSYRRSWADMFEDYALDGAAHEQRSIEFEMPLAKAGSYGFAAPDEWGRRISAGEVQFGLMEMVEVEARLQQEHAEYRAHLGAIEAAVTRMADNLNAQHARKESRAAASGTIIAMRVLEAAASRAAHSAEYLEESAWKASIVIAGGVPEGADDVLSSVRGTALAGGYVLSRGMRFLWNVAEGFAGSANAVAEIMTALALFDQVILEELENSSELAKELSVLLQAEESKRLAVLDEVHRLEMLLDRVGALEAEGLRILDEREAFNMAMAAKAQRNRYKDMVGRLARNEALGQYQSAFDNALRFAWLAAKAYDYETALAPGDPAAATTILERLVKERQLGHWVDGQPQIGSGGLAEILATMKANYDVLEGQLGLNNPQQEVGQLSLRREMMRIGSGGFESEKRWQQALQASRVDNLWSLPAFREYCKYPNPNLAQPGIVLEFSTEISQRMNAFGRQLGGADHAFSVANYATKIRSHGVWFEQYDDANLATTPRVFLVPVGMDRMRVSDNPDGIRSWNVLEQKIPTPYVINGSHLENPGFIPSINGIDGSFSDRRRFGDFRAYHDGGFADSAAMVRDSRLVGRSVWNTRWLLIIPGETVHADPDYGLDQFIQNVSDVKVSFETYSNSGN